MNAIYLSQPLANKEAGIVEKNYDAAQIELFKIVLGTSQATAKLHGMTPPRPKNIVLYHKCVLRELHALAIPAKIDTAAHCNHRRGIIKRRSDAADIGKAERFSLLDQRKSSVKAELGLIHELRTEDKRVA